MKKADKSIKNTIKRRIEIKQQPTKMSDRNALRRSGTPPIRVGLVSRNNLRLGRNPNINNIDIKVDAPTKKTYVFNQFAGIGDILFVESIMRRYFQNGHSVVLPVYKRFLDLQSYFPYIKFIDMDLLDINYEERAIIETDDYVIIPLRFSNNKMSNKYDMVNMDFNEWRTLTWLRHRNKEEKLKDVLGIKDGEKYNLINHNFTSELPFRNRKIAVRNGIKNIKMEIVDGYNLLDWSGVIEAATTIHTVNTSILYLLETLELSTEDIHIYSRNVKGRDFRDVDYLFNMKYTKHE